MDIDLGTTLPGPEPGPLDPNPWVITPEDSRLEQELKQAFTGTKIGALTSADQFGPSELGKLAAIMTDPKEALVEVVTSSLDVLLAEATADVGALFMSPAAQVGTALAVGLAHAHIKAPMVTLPSVGPVLFGCASVLVSYIPAARCGDFGVAFTCGGTPPFFQVSTGSSKVFIGGARAARMGDFTSHCSPPEKATKEPIKSFEELGAGAVDEVMGQLGRTLTIPKTLLEGVVGIIGAKVGSDYEEETSRSKALIKRTIAEARLARARAFVNGDERHDAQVMEDEFMAYSFAASEAESYEANARGQDLRGKAAMIQRSMDTAAGVFKALAGSDPAIGPTLGAIAFGWPTVLIGGFPMPSSEVIASGLGKALSKGASAFSRLRDPKSRKILGQMARGVFSPARMRESIGKGMRYLSGDPVDVISGAVVADAVDATLRGGWPLEVARHYSSAWSERDLGLGFGWSVSIDQALWLERGQVVVRIEDGRELAFEHEDGVDPRGRGLVLVDPVEALRLRSLGDGGWELLGGDGVRRVFAPVAGDGGEGAPRGLARLVRMHGPEGALLAFEYDDHARLRAVRGPGGRTLGLRRGPAGRLVALTLPRPDGPGEAEVVRYEHSPAGDLIAVTDACGGRERLAYDDHRLVEAARADGQRFFFAYDGPGSAARCVRAWGEGEVYVRELVYNPERRMTVVTHGDGEVVVVHADGFGRLLQVDDARGGSRRCEYDALGRRIAEVDPLGHTRRFEYDDLGRPIREVDADGAARSLEYDERGRVSAAVDAIGGRARNLFDAEGRLTAVIDPLGATTEVRSAGRTTIQIDPEGQRTRIDRDEHGVPIAVEAPAGGRWRITYDRRGRPIELVDPRGRSERRRYDACDRLIAVEASTGERQALRRDDAGRLIAADGDAGAIERAYHPTRRLAARRDERGVVSRDYDGDGHLVALSRGDGATHAIDRDPRRSVVGERTFDGRALAYERDLGDRITAVVHPSGARTEYEYDAAGRVIEVRYADGARERFAYRGDGRMIAATREEEGAAVTVEIERDAVGRVLREVQGGRWVAADHDRCGRRRRVVTSEGLTVTIERDGAGRPRAIAAEQGGRRWQVRIARDRAGDEVERALPGEVTASWRRDEAGRPCERTIVGPLAAPSSWDQSLGRPRGRLGERRHLWAGPRRLQAVVQDGRALLGEGALAPPLAGITHVRDADGRVVERVHPDGRVDRLRWDAAHRLREVITADGGRVRYDYDALGRRIRRIAGEEVTTWLWDGDLPVHEATRAGAEDMSRRTWLFDPESWAPLGLLEEAGGGRPSAMISVISDLVGAPMMAVDERGAVVWRGAPTPDGAAIVAWEGSTLALPLQFPGHYADPRTGLHDNRHRVYDPAARRYLSADPLGLAGGLDPHAYVDDPWTMLDPLGQAQRSALDGHGEAPGATAYQAPRPPAVDALLGPDDEPSPVADAIAGFALTAAVSGGVLYGAWRASKGCPR